MQDKVQNIQLIVENNYTGFIRIIQVLSKSRINIIGFLAEKDQCSTGDNLIVIFINVKIEHEKIENLRKQLKKVIDVVEVKMN